jgi:hypothetical protein
MLGYEDDSKHNDKISRIAGWYFMQHGCVRPGKN